MELLNFSYAGLTYEEEWVNRYDPFSSHEVYCLKVITHNIRLSRTQHWRDSYSDNTAKYMQYCACRESGTFTEVHLLEAFF